MPTINLRELHCLEERNFTKRRYGKGTKLSKDIACQYLDRLIIRLKNVGTSIKEDILFNWWRTREVDSWLSLQRVMKSFDPKEYKKETLLF